MERQIATTREQSDRLLKCGVQAESADMSYQFIDECVNNTDKPICSTPKEQYNTLIGYGFGDSRIHITPAWSLGCLLGLLPKELDDFPFTRWYEPFQDGWEICDKEDESTINGEVKLYFSDGRWIVDYDWDGFTGRLPQSDNPIEACVLAIELLIANGYELNGIEKGGEA